MKALLPTFLLGILLPGAAGAASFAALEPAGTRVSPSIIFLGTPAAAEATAAGDSTAPHLVALAQPPAPDYARPPATAGIVTAISPSIIALGAREPEIDLTHLAGVPQPAAPRPRNPHLPPMVIRGGIDGGAFAQGTGAQQQPRQASANGPDEAARPAGAAAAKQTPDRPGIGGPPAPEAPAPVIRPLPTAKVE